MRTIIHISDLHFGAEDPKKAERLLMDIHRDKPSVVVLSGDLTQRAKKMEFQLAKEFLSQIESPKVVVPGNHDIPLYNLYGRFINRLARFKKHISPNIDEVYEDSELAIFGINSARSLTFKEGRISESQINKLNEYLSDINSDKLKILVTHHPLPSLKRAGLAIPVLERGGIDMILTGHVHESSVDELKTDLLIERKSILAIAAGTAISARTRGEPNSYNVLSISDKSVRISLRVWSENSFKDLSHYEFTKSDKQWTEVLDK